jgi:hypothetical protein
MRGLNTLRPRLRQKFTPRRMKMNRAKGVRPDSVFNIPRILAVLAIAAVLIFLAMPAATEPVRGVTVDNATGCFVSDLSTESMALISRWYTLNQKMNEPGPQGTLTDEEFAEGRAIIANGQCGLLRGGVPVTIVLLDGTIYLAKFPDGALIGITSDGFVRDDFNKEFQGTPE